MFIYFWKSITIPQKECGRIEFRIQMLFLLLSKNVAPQYTNTIPCAGSYSNSFSTQTPDAFKDSGLRMVEGMVVV